MTEMWAALSAVSVEGRGARGRSKTPGYEGGLAGREETKHL